MLRATYSLRTWLVPCEGFGASAPAAERWDFQWRWVTILIHIADEVLTVLGSWVDTWRYVVSHIFTAYMVRFVRRFRRGATRRREV